MRFMREDSGVSNISRFPPITKPQAVEVAMRHRGMREYYRCASKRPPRLYMTDALEEPCWYVCMSGSSERFILTSSWVVAVSRVTGRIVAEGSAGDEG
jgi:hypothetical protein